MESTVQEDVGGMPYYIFDYLVESTRGFNHYIAKAAVKAQRLFVLTVQIKEKDYQANTKTISGIIDSFAVR